MAHDVMISHSHTDKPAADAACAALEARGIRCWIAPRDINPGQDWAASIVEAIGEAQILLLVFSRNANQSPQVQREVAQAANTGKALLPLRIEDVLPQAALQYYLGTPHWLDAITPPFEAHLEKLADACASLVAVTGRSPQPATSDGAPVVAASVTEQPLVGEPWESEPSVSLQPPTRGSVSTSTPAEIQPTDYRPPTMPWWQRQRREVQLGLIAAIVVILAAGTGITGYLLRQPSTTSQPSTTTAPTTTTTPAAPQMSGHYAATETTPRGRTVSNDWYFTPCGDGCASVSSSPDGSNPWGQAHFANGQWTMDTHVGVGCSDGTKVPDAAAGHYAWDANTLAGTDRETATQAACGNPVGYQETNTLQLRKA